MGAWDVEAFDNDTTCDWKAGLQGVSDLSYVQETLSTVLETKDEYLDANVACVALAACEVIARLKGNFGYKNSYTESVDQWVESNPQVPSSEVVEMAIAVIDRIQTPPSELMELWEEGDGSEWHASVDELRQRVEN